MVDRFVEVGNRWFSHDSWHRVPFQPILYFFLWSATLRIVITDNPPIRFEFIGTYTYTAWATAGLLCPPLALFAWWLMKRSKWRRGPLAALWIRLGADLGQLVALLTYHIVSVFTVYNLQNESRIYARYCVGAATMLVIALVLRDLWSIVLMERVAAKLRERE